MYDFIKSKAIREYYVKNSIPLSDQERVAIIYNQTGLEFERVNMFKKILPSITDELVLVDVNKYLGYISDIMKINNNETYFNYDEEGNLMSFNGVGFYSNELYSSDYFSSCKCTFQKNFNLQYPFRYGDKVTYELSELHTGTFIGDTEYMNISISKIQECTFEEITVPIIDISDNTKVDIHPLWIDFI